MGVQKIITKNKALISILILALAVRILFVFVSPIKLWDETVYINLGYDLSRNFLDYSFSNGWSDFVPGGLYPRAGFRAPLLPYIIALFFFLRLDFFIDLFMPLIGTASVFFVYILGKKLFNVPVGLYSAFFLAFLPLHVFLSGRILTGVLATFFLILSILSFWKGYEENNNVYKILFGFFLALAFLTRYPILWVMPLFLFYFLVRDKSISFLKDKYLWQAIGVFFLTLSPLFIYSFFEYGSPIGAIIHGAKAGLYWSGSQPWYFFFISWFGIFSIVGIIFLFSLFYLIYKKEYVKKEIYILLIWIVLVLFFASFTSHKENRYILPMVSALCILSGFYIDKLKKYKQVIIKISVILLLFSLGIMFLYFQNYYKSDSDCFIENVNYLQGINGDFLMVSENPPIFRYFVKQESAFYPHTLVLEELVNLEESTENRVYFIFTRLSSSFEAEKVENLKKILRENYVLEFQCSSDPNSNFIYSNIG